MSSKVNDVATFQLYQSLQHTGEMLLSHPVSTLHRNCLIRYYALLPDMNAARDVHKRNMRKQAYN